MHQAALPIVPQVSNDLLEQYSLQMLRLPEDDNPLQRVLREMESIAEKESIPIIGALEGRILAELISMRHPPVVDVLDIGTAIGYSAIWMASVLGPGGHITSIELDQERAARAKEFIQRAGVQNQVEVIVGDIFEILPQQNKKFDAIFQDVMKHVYFARDPELAIKLLDLCIQHLKIYGLLLTDNAFCHGRVLEYSEYNQVKGIQTYNQTIAKHKQMESLLLPFRDGLWFSRRLV
jgi:predicted O-methyltransferase YrrM